MGKNIDYWEEALKNAPVPYRQWFREEKQLLQTVITLDSTVLDVGCGNGRSIFDILSITEHIVGIDHDEKAVLDAKNQLGDYPTVKIIKAEATAMPSESDVFDFVICMGTFANFADKKMAVLGEMSRVLKPSGKIIISVYSEDAFDARMALYRSTDAKIKSVSGTTVVFDESFGDNISEQFSEQELMGIFAQAKLEAVSIVKVGIGYLCILSK